MSEKVLTVSAINNYIKSIFENNIYLQSFLIEGEISNFKYHSSGHLYFILKDNNSQINCVMFASSARILKFMPKNGNKVLIRGKLSSYPQGGTYQIYVSNMKLQGSGELYIRFEQLKKELYALGYFDAEHKKKLPRFVNTIAVITSETGAVIRDIIKTINKRYNKVRVILYPARVQGEGAKEEIAFQINKVNIDNLADVIILARGGGSIEDLWPFNERIVAEAIYASRIPIVSAIGHETDFTIADYVADMRAPTPTAAGTLVVPDKASLEAEINAYFKIINKIYANKMAEYNLGVINLEKRLDMLNPLNALKREKQDLNNLLKHLNLVYDKQISNFKAGINNLNTCLLSCQPKQVIKLKYEKLNKISNNLKNNFMTNYQAKKQNYLLLNAKLESLNPLKIMAKGFSIASKDGKYLKSVNDAKIGDIIETKFADGQIKSKILEVK